MEAKYESQEFNEPEQRIAPCRPEMEAVWRLNVEASSGGRKRGIRNLSPQDGALRQALDHEFVERQESQMDQMQGTEFVSPPADLAKTTNRTNSAGHLSCERLVDPEWARRDAPAGGTDAAPCPRGLIRSD